MVDRPGQSCVHYPDFIGVGAMRCGTTWITERLRAHPAIHIPEDFKEVHFFDKFYDKGMPWYLSNFNEASPGQIFGEFTPNYMRSPEALERMAKHCSQSKIIVSLRDPVERIQSHHEFLRIRKEISPDIGEAIADERYDLLNAGMYGKQMQAILEHYPMDRVHVILFDDIRYQPDRVLQSLYQFLDVNDSFKPEGLTTRSNARHGVRSRGLAAVMRWVRHWVKPSISGRQRFKRWGIFKVGKWINRLNSTRASRQKMDDSTQTKIREMYADDLRLLDKLLHGRVSHWLP